MAQNIVSKGLRYTYAYRKKHIIDHIGSENYDPREKWQNIKLTKWRRIRALTTQHHARAVTLVLVAFLLLLIGLATDNNYNSAAYRTGVWTPGGRKERKKRNPIH